MAYIPGKTIKMKCGYNYFFHTKHRGKPVDNISCWSIDCKKEFDLAENCVEKDYIEQRTIETGFGLLKEKNNLCVLGENIRVQELKLAKFVHSQPLEWHGYPADYVANQQDKPNNQTLKKLHNDDLLTKKEMRLITKGQGKL